MKKIKDRITIGVISGVLSSAPLQIFDALIHDRGITDVPYGYSASRIFLKKDKTKSPASKALSAAINFTNSSIVATAIVYTLSLTGKDKALLKGVGIATLMWIGIAGMISKVGLNIQSKRPITPIISLAQHVVFGAMCSYIITRFGDDSLFPAKKVSQQNKIPVVYTGRREL